MSKKSRARRAAIIQRGLTEKPNPTVILPELFKSTREPLDSGLIKATADNTKLLESLRRNIADADGPYSAASLRAGELITLAIDRGVEPREVGEAMSAGLVEGIRGNFFASPERER